MKCWKFHETDLGEKVENDPWAQYASFGTPQSHFQSHYGYHKGENALHYSLNPIIRSRYTAGVVHITLVVRIWPVSPIMMVSTTVIARVMC